MPLDKGGRPDGRQGPIRQRRNRRMARRARFRRGFRGPRQGRRDPRPGGHLRPPQGRAPAVRRQHRLRQHHPARSAAAPSRRPQARDDDPALRPLERGGDRGQGQQGILRARRPHRELPVGGDPLRHRLHAFLARRDRGARRRPRLLPGPQLARRLCARLPRGAADRGAAAQLPPGGRRQGPVVLSASLADAGFLAVPDRLDGPRAADGDLSGALPALSARPRPRRHRAAQGLGVLRRRRDGRAGIARRDLARGPREARQPDLRHQLQPAAPRRAGARQRQDRPGARGRLPRRGLERDQGASGARAGTRCSPGTRRASSAS